MSKKIKSCMCKVLKRTNFWEISWFFVLLCANTKRFFFTFLLFLIFFFLNSDLYLSFFLSFWCSLISLQKGFLLFTGSSDCVPPPNNSASTNVADISCVDGIAPTNNTCWLRLQRRRWNPIPRYRWVLLEGAHILFSSRFQVFCFDGGNWLETRPRSYPLTSTDCVHKKIRPLQSFGIYRSERCCFRPELSTPCPKLD